MINLSSFKKLKKEILSEKIYNLNQNFAFINNNHKIGNKLELNKFVLNLWKQSVGNDMNLKQKNVEECVIDVYISTDRNISISIIFLNKK